MAGQLIDRWVSVFGADLLAPVARRWKGQISEIAKAWGQYEDLPEADHNTLAGVINPEATAAKNHGFILTSRFQSSPQSAPDRTHQEEFHDRRYQH